MSLLLHLSCFIYVADLQPIIWEMSFQATVFKCGGEHGTQTTKVHLCI